MDYPWYAEVSGTSLEQGDIFSGYPLFVPEVTPEAIQAVLGGQQPTIKVDPLSLEVIVVSQSCDLVTDKIDTVIVCPVWELKNAETFLGSDGKKRANLQENIRRGNAPAWHMLNKPGANQDFKIVEFKRIYTTPKRAMEAFALQCGTRLRLLPPYREHLSQAFARYFMRVGLPADIPKFK